MNDFGTQNAPDQVADGLVVSIEYTLRVDGEVVDASDKDEPLQYIHGGGQIIPGLERALTGVSIGQSRHVSVPAVDAYGQSDPSAVVLVSRSEFPDGIPLEAGTPIQVRNIDGEVMDAVITEVQDEHVQLDFNHPLAGKDLEFDVTVLALRLPTDEELEHGHVHGADGHEEDFDDDFDEDDEDEFEEEDDDEEDDEDDLEEDESK